LLRANQLMSAENYSEAASALEELARRAEARGGPRAPFFHIQAGRARAMAGQAKAAAENLEHGLGLFAARGQSGKVTNLGRRVIDELKVWGLTEQSSQIVDYIKTLVPDFSAGTPQSGPLKRPPLPTHCPGCGAPVHPDEVEWMDEITAECAFCGSPVRGT
jgi:hypothetical protein